jgi:hypothetical protein
MEENRRNNQEEVYSRRIKAGKRTYFFDVKATRGNDYYITITESKRRHDGPGYDKHKIFLYKEDFMKFLSGLNEAVDHVKHELLPDFDFDKVPANEHDELKELEESMEWETINEPRID